MAQGVFLLVNALLIVGGFVFIFIAGKQRVVILGLGCFALVIGLDIWATQKLEFAGAVDNVASFDESGKIEKYDQSVVWCEDRCINYPTTFSPSFRVQVTPVIGVIDLINVSYQVKFKIVNKRALLNQIVHALRPTKGGGGWSVISQDTAAGIYAQLVHSVLAIYNQIHSEEFRLMCVGADPVLDHFLQSLKNDSVLSVYLRHLGLQIVDARCEPGERRLDIPNLLTRER